MILLCIPSKSYAAAQALGRENVGRHTGITAETRHVLAPAFALLRSHFSYSQAQILLSVPLQESSDSSVTQHAAAELAARASEADGAQRLSDALEALTVSAARDSCAAPPEEHDKVVEIAQSHSKAAVHLLRAGNDYLEEVTE